jgi:glycosyltransferase involved in cell wall biosynthesis
MANILIFSPLALENGRGGEISSMELAEGLKKNHKITFLDTNILIGKKFLSRREINERLKCVDKNRINFATISFINWTFAIPYPREIIRLYQLVKANDIIYYSFSTIKLNVIFALLSIVNRNRKFIVGYRKPLFSEKFFSIYNLKYRTSILFLSLFKKSFYHHALSKHAKHFLDRFYQPERVIQIVHGINLKKFLINVEKKDRKTLNFCYIGYLDDVHKGIGVLVQAIELLLETHQDLNIKFEICGMGPLADTVQKLADTFPNQINYYGYVDNSEIPNYYKKNDVYLFTSRTEPFPRTIMEALVSGLIIIASKTIGSLELLKGKKFGFFIQDLNPKSIKDEILKVYKIWNQNPKKIENLQQKAKDFVIDNYSFEYELNSFENLIKKISK